MLHRSARFSITACLLPCIVLACVIPVQAAEPTADKRPHVVLVVGTHHYSPQKTLPKFAERLEQYGFRTTVVLPQGDPERNKNGQGLPGLEVLKSADVAVFYMRFLTLPQVQRARPKLKHAAIFQPHRAARRFNLRVHKRPFLKVKPATRPPTPCTNRVMIVFRSKTRQHHFAHIGLQVSVRIFQKE